MEDDGSSWPGCRQNRGHRATRGSGRDGSSRLWGSRPRRRPPPVLRKYCEGRSGLGHGSHGEQHVARGCGGSQLPSEPAAPSPWGDRAEGLLLKLHITGNILVIAARGSSQPRTSTFPQQPGPWVELQAPRVQRELSHQPMAGAMRPKGMPSPGCRSLYGSKGRRPEAKGTTRPSCPGPLHPPHAWGQASRTREPRTPAAWGGAEALASCTRCLEAWKKHPDSEDGSRDWRVQGREQGPASPAPPATSASVATVRCLGPARVTAPAQAVSKVPWPVPAPGLEPDLRVLPPRPASLPAAPLTWLGRPLAPANIPTSSPTPPMLQSQGSESPSSLIPAPTVHREPVPSGEAGPGQPG
ncbi:transcription initiation factor TFIID subunit 4-like [Alligator sinensis]|uniref:Transcription initiation factor TFIID subunit 4-like n=1 Tax=Alligator sinensis TaxID=38654 RepID=A0A1U8DIG3_ALLSI|nr:transcription initiation factor TFIID subunit 4-like [Alligator sinensis]